MSISGFGDRLQSSIFIKKVELNLDESIIKSTKEKIDALLKEKPTLPFKGENVSLTIEEFPILKDNEIQTQINDPQFKKLLSANRNITRYAFKFFDPHRKKPDGYDEAEEKVNKFDTIAKKKRLGSSLTAEEISFEKAEDEQFARIIFESLQEQYNKPMVSLKILENGAIGEVSNITVQSEAFKGRNLMELVDKFSKWIGVKEMFLEDDSKIESPEGGYSLRLYRYFTGQNSWYQDQFKYTPCHVEDSQKIADHLGNKTVKEVLEILENSSINKKRAEKLKELLSRQPVDKTVKELIQEFGNKIVKNKEPLYKEMQALLEGYLESLRSYSGQDPALKQLSREAIILLSAKVFHKVL